MQGEDVFVIILLAAGFSIWGWIALRRWLTFPARQVRLTFDEIVVSDENVQFLESSGYEVVSGKKKIPLRIMVDDEEELYSRMYIDYFARPEGDEDQLYIVKTARDRKPLDLTGSGIRDALLSYFLLYEQVIGILYVDAKQGMIKKIHFEIEDD